MPVLGTQVIKSIQRGNVTLGNTDTTSVTITAVDISKSMLNISNANGCRGGKANNNVSDYTSYGAAIVAGGNLDSSTSIFIRAGTGLGSSSAVAADCRAYWEVIEYA